MQQFKQLLVTLQHTLLQGNLEQTITELVFDSRKAKEGDGKAYEQGPRAT